jgi:brefeldin A-inhibited guanine nucleotide-exchange protein
VALLYTASLCLQEDFAGVTLDIALRRLLHEFKLPGEAQQIDRIMEKFAEAFCRANPGVFRAAEDAYRLAFATVMLNTDVHNPLADHMLGFETFVEMNSDTQEDGISLPVLSEKDLRGIFDRIAAQA